MTLACPCTEITRKASRAVVTRDAFLLMHYIAIPAKLSVKPIKSTILFRLHLDHGLRR